MNIAITLDDLHFAYPGGPPVLRGIDLDIPAGQYAALVGANGSGKSTLLKHLIGLLRPTRGAVHIQGQDIARLPVGEIARMVGFAFQSPEHQIFSATVRDEIAFGPRNLGLRDAALEARVCETLEQFGLTDYAAHPPAVLSFSLRRLVALASIAALRTPILVLDEPLVGLDGLWRRGVVRWLRAHHAAGGTILLVTHHMRLAAKCERVVVLDGGAVAADGPPDAVFSQVEVLQHAGLRPPMVVRLARELGLPRVPLAVAELVGMLEKEKILTANNANNANEEGARE
ncbi:MAG: ATP-binding cassette domain-containing protein [Anaerolineae bacterium]|nr:ATP-binding cassette domain-containing protein [Anaerolineae bacterium]